MRKQIAFALVLLLSGCTPPPPLSPHLKFIGNPSNAGESDLNNLLMLKTEFALSYNCQKGTSNWVAWELNASWLGNAERQNSFRADPDLPETCYHVDGNDYRGSGYDRGHLAPSADRSRDVSGNRNTFLMTNIIPQSAQLNRGIWRELEEYSRKLVEGGRELYIIAGIEGVQGSIDDKVTIPLYNWKIIAIADNNRIDGVIAVRMPNDNSVARSDWDDYLATVDEIEALTGYDFFSELPNPLENEMEATIWQE